jgi:hypothetical protein
MIKEWLIKWWANKCDDAEFTFPAALRSARRILVLMPLDLEELHQSEFFLSRLPQAFPGAKVTLLYPPKSLAPRFYNPYGFTALVPEASHVGPFGMPKRKFLDQLFEQPFDVMIALNRQPTVFFAGVAMSSHTPARIGLPGGMGRPFVTIELRHGREAADTKTEYILFVEMLRKLAAPPPAAAPTA